MEQQCYILCPSLRFFKLDPRAAQLRLNIKKNYYLSVLNRMSLEFQLLSFIQAIWNHFAGLFQFPIHPLLDLRACGCVCMCVYVCMGVCMSVYGCVWVCMGMCMCVYLCMGACMCVGCHLCPSPMTQWVRWCFYCQWGFQPNKSVSDAVSLGTLALIVAVVSISPLQEAVLRNDEKW